MRIKNAIWALALGIFITACENDDNGVVAIPDGDYTDGILVSNEGPFNNGTGTVTFISSDLDSVQSTIFNTVNNEDLGNIVQSIGFEEEKAYIIANVSNKINVVNRYTFEKEASITEGLNNPRYFVAANGKGYVTNWGDTADETDDFIAVINLTTNLVEETISVDFGPEEILVNSNTVYVAHQGAFGNNNKISVIDAESDAVTSTIEVGFLPNSMQLTNDGSLWVLSGGKSSFSGEESAGSLAKINTTTNVVDLTLEFGATEHPNHLSLNNDELYYVLGGAVYTVSTTATALPTAQEFEGLNVYSMTTNDNQLYVNDAKDFASNGTLTIYDLTSKAELKAIEVGIIPGDIYFN